MTSMWVDSANRCAKCGCDLNGCEENVRSPYDEDCCWRCDAEPMLTEEVVSEMYEYFNPTDDTGATNG